VQGASFDLIEVDGITHLQDETKHHDQRRQHDLESAGFTIIRFQDEEVLKDIEGVRKALENCIEQLEQKLIP